ADSTRAFNARDRSALRATYAPSISQIDRLNAGWASSEGRTDMFQFAAESVGDLNDAVAVVQIFHACASDSAVVTTRTTEATADGGTIERSVHILYHRDGRVLDRVELFAEDRLDDALDAFRRVTASGNEPTNSCVEAFLRWIDLFAARDW